MNCFARCSLALGALFAMAPIVRAADTPDCAVGTYRLIDGGVIDIGPSDDGTLRWVGSDGATGTLHGATNGVWTSTYGWTQRSDGITASFPACGQLRFAGVTGRRITFDVTEGTFESHGIKLVGRLVMPKGERRVPIVVLLHGSEQASALSDASLQSYFLQHLLPADKMGVFVYDKRGTGRSGGQYTQDYSVLADDAVAAQRKAREMAGARLARIGYQGGSQAGWVAPLAANRSSVDFVIVCFGLAVNVIDEDQESVELQMREKGYSPEVIGKALEVASAAETVFEDDFKGGIAELDAVKARYGGEPWYKDVHGDFAFFVLQQHSDADLRALAPQFDWHISFHYDPMPVLRAAKAPQLWILGGEDYQAPSAETSRRIKSLIEDGLPFTLAYYPGAEHGMTLFETGPDGERISTRYVSGYFRMIRDFARDGRLHGSYGDAELTTRMAGTSRRPAGSDSRTACAAGGAVLGTPAAATSLRPGSQRCQP